MTVGVLMAAASAIYAIVGWHITSRYGQLAGVGFGGIGSFMLITLMLILFVIFGNS